MALTTTEEAQLRALLVKQTELLSLAASEPSIISELGAGDTTFPELMAATVINDADLLLIRQGTEEKSATGAVLKTTLGGLFAAKGANTDITSLASPAIGSATATTQATNDSTTKVATTAFVNPGSSLASSGWQKLPSGLIIQWVTGSIATAGDQDQTITFPIAFPNECIHLCVSTKSGSSIESDAWFQEKSSNNSSCVVVSQWTGAGNVAGGVTPRIFAIGK